MTSLKNREGDLIKSHKRDATELARNATMGEMVFFDIEAMKAKFVPSYDCDVNYHNHRSMGLRGVARELYGFIIRLD